MTIVGAGGIALVSYRYTNRFKRDLKRLDDALQATTQAKLRQLHQNPFPPGLRFEKLKGYSDPDVYTIHITGNYKVSFEIVQGEAGCVATLRRIGPHKE
jgi:mRNA-degrading endonuclease RelE of RelBE toxin-antitoxin system